MWNAIKRKFRSISSSCCPTLIRPPSGTSPLTPATSCCSSSYYYYDYHSSRSRPIELGYQLSEDEAPAKKRRRGFVRFSGKMKTKKLTEKAVNELNLYGSQGHRVVPDPIDLNAIDPWLSGVRPMDPEMRREVEYLVQTYDKEYEKLEQSVVLPSKQADDDAASIAPSAASNTSKRSAYHLDRVDFATRIRYAKEAAMKENAAKHEKKSKIGKEKPSRSKKLNRNLAVSVYSLPLQPPEYKRYNTREGFVALKEKFSSSSSSRSSSSSSSDSSRKKEKKSKKKKKSKKRKSRKRNVSSKDSASGKSHKKTELNEKGSVVEPENDAKRDIKVEENIEETSAGNTMIEVAKEELDIEKADRNIDVEES